MPASQCPLVSVRRIWVGLPDGVSMIPHEWVRPAKNFSGLKIGRPSWNVASGLLAQPPMPRAIPAMMRSRWTRAGLRNENMGGRDSCHGNSPAVSYPVTGVRAIGNSRKPERHLGVRREATAPRRLWRGWRAGDVGQASSLSVRADGHTGSLSRLASRSVSALVPRSTSAFRGIARALVAKIHRAFHPRK